ncbi:FkbM family methyltransferase [Sphingomonas gei]|uniref:FkbM family methyltransferase n=1 Tax=Sphingomonas gei TaxID=1395960 RepID=A0A4S1WYK6_9SPHN|nr:FkbM family methyltransferase [Sphingomonas gei]TGX48664.1 FkbM family methyltransferase [Sphingomonas gei]
MRNVSHSIVKEDILLARVLREVPAEEGFYIDVGANDPDIDSVTKLFYDRGWRGINIEPSPHWWRRLEEVRTRDFNLNVAISDQRGTALLYDHPQGGLGTLLESLAQRHADRLGLVTHPTDVVTMPLSDVIRKYSPKVVHFLKVDVEGFEERVLRGMDFAECRPWVLCIEATEPNMLHVSTHERWESMLLSSGYHFAQFDSVNRWYLADEKRDLLVRFANVVDDYVSYHYVKEIRRLRNYVAELQTTLAELRRN